MHLYVHVPFCARRCSYCDFAIAVRSRVPEAAFVEAMAAEWRRHLAEGDWEGTIDTLYLGGGTPSRLGADAIARLIGTLAEGATLSPAAEITLEANPEDVSREAASGWRRAGVNRVSLGVQSFEDRALGWMHRVHDGAGAVRAVGELREAGVANLSLDLIYGLPAELERSWERDLERALGLEPEHLSFYGLTIEPKTPLARWVDRGQAGAAVETAFEAEYLAAHRALTAGGWAHYEVSNAARPGFESRHNLAYWTGRPYLGLGPSAHSFRGGRRWWNERHWAEYQRRARHSGETAAGEERLGPAERALEERYLGLRTDRGVAASTLPIDLVTEWESAGWARLVGSRVVLTARGWLRLDALVTRLG